MTRRRTWCCQRLRSTLPTPATRRPVRVSRSGLGSFAPRAALIQCAELAPQVYRYLHESQRKYMVPKDYLRLHQTDITSNMTGILLDWLVEVAEE